MKNKDLSKCPCLTFCNFMFRCQNLIRFKHQLIVRSIVPPTLLAHHPATYIQTHKSAKATKIHTLRPLTYELFFQICSTLVRRVFSFCVRDLTKLRRRRQRETSPKSKTTTLHVHHAFLYISLQSLHNYDLKWRNFKFTWERERRSDKFNHLCQNLGRRSLLFSSKLNFLLLSNWAPWNNRKKECKDGKSTFQRRFHERRRCRIVRSPI